MTTSRPPRFRLIVIAALWVTALFLFLDRVNISFAAPSIMDELGLSGVETGLILSVYYWGYIAGQIGGGIASDRFSLKGACRTVAQFAPVRGLIGIAEGSVANPINKLENQWLLPQERGWVYGATVGFGYLGIIAGVVMMGWLIEVWGWRAMFYGTGALTVAGVLLFWLLVYDRPREHPRVSPEEVALIEGTITKDRVTFDPRHGGARPLTFAAGVRLLAGHWVFWAICACVLFTQCVGFTNLSWLPGYLVKERGYTIMKGGAVLAIPYLTAFAGALCGGYPERVAIAFSGKLAHSCSYEPLLQ